MKLYQKFLYSALLITIFVSYATTKNLMIDTQRERMSAKQARVEALMQDVKYLEGQIASIEIKNKKVHEELMVSYIKKTYRSTPQIVAKEIAKSVITISAEKDLPAPLVLGIIQVESNFNPYAISKAGARGLMQVMPEWVGKLPTKLETKYDLHEISKGIRAGADVFNIHLEENAGNITKALYYYVNKDNTYSYKVFKAVGEYIAHAKQ